MESEFVPSLEKYVAYVHFNPLKDDYVADSVD
jgi:hypothetical protein